MIGVVVDANIGRSCGRGNLASNSPAPECIRALIAIMSRGREKRDLTVAVSSDWKDEWSKHAGEYAKRWLGSMIARKLVIINNQSWEGEAALVDAAETLPGKQAREVLKDIHLVRLAMLTGERVVSMDDRQREFLIKLSSIVVSICRLHWANPKNGATEKWLQDGVPERLDFCIGTFASSS